MTPKFSSPVLLRRASLARNACAHHLTAHFLLFVQAGAIDVALLYVSGEVAGSATICLLPAACCLHCVLLATHSSRISLTSGASAVVQAVGGSELNRGRRVQAAAAVGGDDRLERCGL